MSGALARRRTAAAVVVFVLLYMFQFVVFGAPPAAGQSEGEQDISAHNVGGDYECDPSEWHFVITQIDKEEPAPPSIEVTFETDGVVTVLLDNFTGGVAHYSTAAHLDDTVVSATAVIYSDWDGQFNLSHGPCGEGTTTTTTEATTTTTTEATTTTTTEPTTTTTTVPSKQARITVVKEVPGEGSSEEFLFSMSTVEDFWLGDGESESFAFEWTYDGPKTITVSEHDDLLGEGWSFVDVACVDGSGQPAQVIAGEWPAQVYVTLYDGGEYTCTFTNESEEVTTTTTQATTTTTTVPSKPTTTTTVPATVLGTQVTTSTTVPFDEEVAVAGIQVTPSTTTTIPAVSAETLPFTGAELGEMALLGAAVLAGGSLIVYGARKRDDEDERGTTSTL